MKKCFTTLLSIAALAAFGKPASTHWEANPQPNRHGIAYRCPHCGQTWANTPPNLKAWETRHIEKERGKFIALHMRVRHGKKTNKRG